MSESATTWEANGMIRHRCECGCVMERKPKVAVYHWRMVSYCERHRFRLAQPGGRVEERP